MKNLIANNSSMYRFMPILGLLFMTILLSQEVQAQGDLLITPRRVVFEGAKRSQELILSNMGKDTAKYNVSIMQFRMKEDGSFQEIFTKCINTNSKRSF